MIAEIVFAAGCFWGVEKHFEQIPGVQTVQSGYTGGNYENPTYRDVLNNRYKSKNDDNNLTNHTEAVLVKFDTTKIKAKDLIKSFWEIHDPTQINGQGNDIGNNYRSALFYTNQNQKNIAFKTKAEYQKLLSQNNYGKIVTQIQPLTKFYNAEEYHQDYLAKNPNGYCPNHATGVKFDDKNKVIIKDLIPIDGKEIIVVESQEYCPYCEKFKKDVSDNYQGTLKMRYAISRQLKNYKINTDISGTPTILFLENGIEQISHIGYMNEELFYKTLGIFKLGKNTQAYNIAFNEGTESRFCKQYEIFKNTSDGVFIDILSGDILFDTKDRFNSSTGWLSFYKAVEGSTVELEDNSYGMNRVEVRAKNSGIHLGHVFEEMNNKRRFCINANVLEFVKRKDVEKLNLKIAIDSTEQKINHENEQNYFPSRIINFIRNTFN